MYKRNVSHSDTELNTITSYETSRKKISPTVTERRQESSISVRSRKSSSGKHDLPNYVSFRSRSSLSLHLLDVCSQDLETLCQGIVPSVSYMNIDDSMSEFISHWIDPIFRLYFLMYLSYLEYQTLFFLEHDLTQLATDYNIQSTITRPKLIKHIYTEYLTHTSPAVVMFSAEPRSPSPEKVIQVLQNSLNNSSPSLMNDLFFLVYETLAKHYHGTFVNSDQVVYSGPVVNKTVFKDSVFWQMYEKDKNKNYISFKKYKRIGERILMMRSNAPVYSLYTKVLETYQFGNVLPLYSLDNELPMALDFAIHNFSCVKMKMKCECCFDKVDSDILLECKNCLITVHESCKDEVLNSCFFTESMKITKSVICVQGNDTNGQKTENISETSDLLSCLTLNDNNLDKMEEVMTEIIDSELKYTDDMNTTSKIFIKTLKKLGIVGEDCIKDIFSNLDSIVDLHKGISSSLSEIQNSSHGILKLEKMIDVYEMNSDEFYLYKIYCANQSNSSRTLKLLDQNPEFNDFKSKCERNTCLNKLNLSDLLVKPMHRITRYNLLLKRLLSYISPLAKQYNSLKGLIDFFSDINVQINHAVQVENSLFTLKMYDQKMDAGICEKFMIENKYRHLITEIQCTYIKGKNEFSDITLSLFSDLVLILKRRKNGLQLYRNPIPVESLILLDYSTKEADEKQFSILHIGKGMHTLIAPSVRDKTVWLQSAEFHRREFLRIYRNRELQLFQSNQPVPLPSFDDQLHIRSDSSSSVESLTARKLTLNSDNQVNILEMVKEEDGVSHRRSFSILSSKSSHNSSISEISKHLSIDGFNFMGRWSSNGRSKNRKSG